MLLLYFMFTLITLVQSLLVQLAIFGRIANRGNAWPVPRGTGNFTISKSAQSMAITGNKSP